MTGEYSWTQPCCEACWIDEHGEWDMDSDEAEVWQHLVSCRQPVMSLEAGLERCAFCGRPTVVGIYVRHDPNDVPYPAKRDVEDVDTGGKV